MNQEGQTEKVFYKYSAIKDSLIENIKNHQIYFSDPANFNDIADCKFNFYFKANRQRWIREMRKLNEFRLEQLEQQARKQGFNTIDDLLNNIIDYYINEKRFQLEGDLIYSDYDKRWHSAKPVVSCFCEYGNNPLMWGLYANRHKGVCIGYKSKRINNKYKITLDSNEEAFLKVRYCEKPPSRINLFDDEAINKVHEVVRTKFKKWDYEDEYRIILTEDKQKKERAHKREDLERVIFGSKVEYCDAYRVYRVIKDYYSKKGIQINYYKIQESQGKYELKMEPINIEEFMHALQYEKM
ncbi:MAG TPA: DUF2971 domain-containing protein [Methanosarcina sp.]|nr:DUF2971 domain-containing protein [Methanosarcina sp.]